MLPFARNTISRTTSPSILRLRPSAVYSGRGLSRMSTGVVGLSLAAAFFLGVSVATVWSANPVVCSVPRLGLLGGGFATPFPKPVLATVPRIPLSPPVPFPYPGPPGNAGEPRRLTFVALFGSPLPGIPLGSPNPPVCTLFSGATTVGTAALPDPRLPTFTSSFGRFGWFFGPSIFTCSKTGLSSTGFAYSVFILGGSALAPEKHVSVLGSASPAPAQALVPEPWPSPWVVVEAVAPPGLTSPAASIPLGEDSMPFSSVPGKVGES